MSDVYEVSNDIYNQGGAGEYPPPGGVGTDIIWESIGIYQAAQTQSFSNNGEWFAGVSVSPFDKPNDLVATLIDTPSDPTAELQIGVYDFFTGDVIEVTPKFLAAVGVPSEFLNNIAQTLQGMSYRLAVWGNKNTPFKYDNGLQSLGGTNFGLRSQQGVTELPANLFINSTASPVYPYIILF